MNPKIALAGGSGFIGHALAPMLIARGYEVVVLGRGAERSVDGVTHLQWDGKTVGNWAQALDGARAIVNLAGKNIDCRHTPANRAAIISSRVESVRVLGDAAGRCAKPPEVFVQASATGFYGDTGDRTADENAPSGADFMAEVCRQWEGAFEALQLPGTRKVVLRIGFVLGRNGGALKVLEQLTRLFLGSAVGNGRQFISWVHIDDLCRMIIAAIEKPELAAVFNAVAPTPVTNTELMREMRHVLRRPWVPPVPAPVARAGAWLMGSEGDLALLSYRCVPRRFLEHGFAFAFPELKAALADLYRDA
jgi:uncharacterized protein (TIGR01777 family)